MSQSKKKQGVYTKINKKFYEQSNEAILKMLANDALRAGDYKHAQKVLLHMNFNDPDFFGSVFAEWSRELRTSEKELMMTRFVLA